MPSAHRACGEHGVGGGRGEKSRWGRTATEAPARSERRHGSARAYRRVRRSASGRASSPAVSDARIRTVEAARASSGPAHSGAAAGARSRPQREITIVDLLVRLIVLGTNGRGAIGAKGYVTVTTTRLPGSFLPPSGQLTSVWTGIPTVVVATKSRMSAVPAARPLVLPRTAAQRTPSRARADTTYSHRLEREQLQGSHERLN